MKVTVQQFLDFAKGKPGDETFSYWGTMTCALAQFGQALTGDENVTAGSHYFVVRNLDEKTRENVVIDGLPEYFLYHLSNRVYHETGGFEIPWSMVVADLENEVLVPVPA